MTSSPKFQNLTNAVQTEISKYRRLKYFNQILGGVLALFGISLSLVSTLYGINDQAKLAAEFAAGSATIQAILFAYPLERRSQFYRKLIADSQNLLLDVDIDSFSKEEQKFLEQVKALRSKAAAEEPEGAMPENLEGIEKSIANIERLLAEYNKLKDQVKKD